MHLNLTRKQVVDLLFALELAEDNAPDMRRWEELRTELRLQLRVDDAGSIYVGMDSIFSDYAPEDPEPYSDLGGDLT